MMTASTTILEPVLVLVGPTAIGKTELSIRLAERFDCEIVSMDSMQVYRYMDIGTAKASREERGRIVHHLIDIVDPDEQYDAAAFIRDAQAAIAAITARGRVPLITGGTGLYLHALINGLFAEVIVAETVREQMRQRLEQEGRGALHEELCSVDPASGARIHVNDTQRLLRGLEIYHATGIPWSEHIRRQQLTGPPAVFSNMLQLGLTCDRTLLNEKIKKRTFKMMNDSFQKEVEFLIDQGFRCGLPSMQALGYRHMCGCLDGTWDRDTATDALVRDTRRYAKRQITWFRGQADLHWHEAHCTEKIFRDVDLFLQKRAGPAHTRTGLP
ncbi:tRNA (adenosine(37)-N6)-dimethylallyltransferase MiaA [Desulfobulbus alkaliphilus]|uniref:tRNA (adenosine(37)-N6)-dimethylallyltransferase MiaA n=1 Tax=Desulfobulbus alkaliphilus TaxID=869814 RepID=UPI0019661E72|nr:tRNA (adenosine(37)-N6)-dimethylallyltransferase MiaA [Desulfobulbus alkaliphilus]MBM9537584.1 tRNA (adenosine(37)-N6)-dimethylallyltransferase MiaA [Desulfobulbus alkaliphilus]